MERVGFYSGSFDPVTYGHLDVIRRSFRLVDHVVVGIGVSATKNGTPAARHQPFHVSSVSSGTDASVTTTAP